MSQISAESPCGAHRSTLKTDDCRRVPRTSGRHRREELEVLPDHVHLLVSVDPPDGIHRLMKLIKGRASRLLRQEFPELLRQLPTLWTNSYVVATTGGAPLHMIKQACNSLHSHGEQFASPSPKGGQGACASVCIHR